MGKNSKKTKQKGGSQCYSTECANHALKTMNDKNALVPFNKNTSLEHPLLTRQMNIIKGGGSENVWRKIGLSKPNDLVNNIFDGLQNVKNTWIGDEQGSTSNTLEHPINNEKLSNKIEDITLAKYVENISTDDRAAMSSRILVGSGKKRKSRKRLRKGRNKVKTSNRKKRKTGKRKKRKTGKRKTGKRCKQNKRCKRRTNKR